MTMTERSSHWLLWVSFVGPHEPFDTPAPWHGRNRAEALPKATPLPAWVQQLQERCELRRAAAGWAGQITPEAVAACRADYADHLARHHIKVDAAAGASGLVISVAPSDITGLLQLDSTATTSDGQSTTIRSIVDYRPSTKYAAATSWRVI